MTWLKRLFSRTRAEAQLDAELRDHLTRQIADYVRDGMSEADARRRARLEFGGLDQIKELCRDARGTRAVDECMQDIAYGVRLLRKTPGVSTIAVLTLALGIGATTAVFSFVDGVALRPLPYSEPERLVWVWGQLRGGTQRSSVNPLEFVDYRDQATSFEQFGAGVAFTSPVTLTGHGEPEVLRAGVVSANFFDVLGVRPMLGRGFDPAADEAAEGELCVLSHSLWQQRFGGAASIVGSTITIDDRPTRVVGIMPAGFRPPQRGDLWLRFSFAAARQAGNRRSHYLRPLGRLKHGVTLEQAQAELDVIARRLETRYPETSAGWRLQLVPLDEHLTAAARQAAWVIFAAVMCLLLMACANLAGLLLARASARSGEIGMRAALGAGRRRIIQQLLTETALVALLGAAGGVALAYALLPALLSLAGTTVPGWAEVVIDMRVLAFAAGVTLATALMCGLMPAIEASRPALANELKLAGRQTGSGPRPRRLRAVLVVAQLTATFVLLIGAGLLVRSFMRLQQVDPGFAAGDTLALRLDLPRGRYPQPQQVAQFHSELHRELSQIRGVEAVGLVSELPLSGQMNDWPFAIEGRAAEQKGTVDVRFVNAHYLRAMSIPLLQGKAFSDDDAARSARVTLISRAMADRLFPDGSAIGQRIRLTANEAIAFEIIGIVGDVRHRSLAAETYPTMYVPSLASLSTANVVVRIAGSTPADLGANIRAIVHGLDRNLAIADMLPLEQLVDASVASRRANTILLGAFATLALIFAVTGVYGLVSYGVAERVREIGVRMALGARTGDIRRLVLLSGARLGLAGALLGLAGAVAVSRAMTGLLFGVSATDVPTYASIVGLLLAIVLLACWLPARRAARIDPLTATRCE